MDFSSLSAPRVSEERKRLGLNQEAAGAKCGVSREMWGKYERGKAAMGGDVLMHFANAGADVQYVLTGVRSSLALTPEERLLLDRYRQSTQGLRDAALRVLLGDKASGGMTFKGSVGQSVKVEGNLDQSGISFDMGKGKKRK